MEQSLSATHSSKVKFSESDKKKQYITFAYREFNFFFQSSISFCRVADFKLGIIAALLLFLQSDQLRAEVFRPSELVWFDFWEGVANVGVTVHH